MRKKSIVLALILIIASAGIGTGFSLAANGFQTNGTIAYIYGINFTAVSYSDNEIEKEVADGIATIIDTQNIQVTITNAYPGYIAYIDFTILNTGQDPILLDDLTIGTYNTDALYVEVIGIIEWTFLIPGETIDAQLIVEVLQDAEMGVNYPFNVDIGFAGSPQ